MKMLKITGVCAVLAFATSLAAADDKAKAPAGKDAKAAPAKDAKAAPAKEDKAAPAKDKVAPMAAPKPGAELDKLKAWVGNWKCKGSMNGADGKAMAYTATIKISSDLGGFWYNAVYTRAKSKEMPQFVGHATLGWDSAAKSYAFIGVDSMGGMMMLHAADALAWTGDASMMGQKAPATYTFTNPDAKHMTTVMAIGGKEMGKDECSK